jgi:DNA-binding NtrC family response regulator
VTYREAMLEARRRYWLALLEQTEWSVSDAAEIADVNRTAAYAVLKQIGIEPQKRERWRDEAGDRRVHAIDMRGFLGARR